MSVYRTQGGSGLLIEMDAVSLGKEVRQALKKGGFQQRGHTWYDRSQDLIWVITPERLWSSPRWALRIGVLSTHLDPVTEWPTDSNTHLQTELQFLATDWGTAKELASALDASSSEWADADRSRYLEDMARRLKQVTSKTLSIEALADLMGGPIGHGALIDKRLRGLLES